MSKVRLTKVTPRKVEDVTSPAAVQRIWAEASRVVRQESAAVQRRRKRAIAG
ncbi:hypothetical protein [Nocardioides lacusdianchii]|uniref:hypothetical protein n=1 Tax=Nocardioides lacusdianchii TaxID=2783664 RepID=UPI001CCF5AD7|nr:hypothetical protein [Nocardioides lacusdianchii]